MSLKTWKEEFYPIPADEVPESQALAHSLRNWEGLRKENLEKHGVESTDSYVDEMPIDSSTCALCQHHVVVETCATCPLSVRGGEVPYNCDPEYGVWVRDGNPEPMIELIKNAINREA